MQRYLAIVNLKLAGDRENHVASLHLANPAYCVLFVAACCTSTLDYRSAVRTAVSHFWGAVSVFALSLLTAFAMWRGSEPHPFVLADNRHYTFYLWRRVLDRYGVAGRVALSPLVAIAAVAVYQRLRKAGRTSLWCIALALCTCVTLIPSPLLEFRYFTVPLLIVRTAITDAQTRSTWIDIVMFAFVNAVVLYVFVYRPFDGVDGVARFMW